MRSHVIIWILAESSNNNGFKRGASSLVFNITLSNFKEFLLLNRLHTDGLFITLKEALPNGNAPFSKLRRKIGGRTCSRRNHIFSAIYRKN